MEKRRSVKSIKVSYLIGSATFQESIVLMGWSLLPNALRPFWDILCSPEFRYWEVNMPIKFCSEDYFQAWGSLTSLKCQTRDSQLKVPPGGLVLRIFTSWKNQSTSAGFEHANLGSRDEHFTPRPSRPTYTTLSVIYAKFWKSRVISLHLETTIYICDCKARNIRNYNMQ